MTAVDTRRRHINVLSRWAAWACLLLIPCIVMLTAGIWIFLPDLVTEGFRVAGAPPMSPLQRLGGFAFTMIPAGIFLYGIWRLYCLFNLFAQGELFSSRAARHLHAFAAALLIKTCLTPFTGAAIGVLASWNNPPGERMLAISLSQAGVAWMLIAALLFALSWIMTVAEEIAEDQKLIV
ncbi:MAG: DUF2975 domain-containing protein [Pseudomonadota bacterium]